MGTDRGSAATWAADSRDYARSTLAHPLAVRVATWALWTLAAKTATLGSGVRLAQRKGKRGIIVERNIIVAMWAGLS